MSTADRDWAVYNEHRLRELSRFTREAKKVLHDMGAPTHEPPPPGKRGRGRPPYSPSAMLLTNLVRLYLKATYRDMEVLLRNNHQLRRTLGLHAAPGRDTIHRYAATVSEAYLRDFNDRLTRRLKKTSSGSASTLPVSRSRGTRDVGTLPRLRTATGARTG